MKLMPTLLSITVALSAVPAHAAKPNADKLVLQLRSRLQPFKGADEWEVTIFRRDISARESAIVICDMWDDHWCKASAKRCAAMAFQMEPVLKAARARGVTIIHAPSDCMAYYKDAPQRKRTLAIAPVEPPRPLAIPDPPLPIDDSDGGCDDNPRPTFRKAWTRQHPALTIAEEDYISDNGKEVYSLLRSKGIKTVFICGVHTNFCVLHRTFAIKQMSRWGVRCILIRDLTDAMYNPAMKPQVSHDDGTNLVIEHIEKHWCPTVLSRDITGK